MKKVMIGILMVIPVIIVLVVSLVSVFVSMSAHIAVDDVAIDKNYLELEYDSSNSVFKLEDLFTVSVMPNRASNKDYTWSIEDLVCINDDYKEMWDAGTAPPPAYLSENQDEEYNQDLENAEELSCSKDGYLHVNTYCVFVLKVQAETHTATCRVNVVGFSADKIKITNTDTTLTIGQNTLLQVETSPIEAIVESWIYESSDEDVVTVDKNGVIKAEGPGTANVKVKASVYGESGKYVEDTITFTVKDGATLFGDSIVTARQEILFSEIGVNASEVEIFDGAEFNTAGNGILLIDDIAIIVVNGKEVSIERCEDGEIVIDNADLFESKDEGGFVLATDGKLYLSASFADSFEKVNPVVTWSSNREFIAKVDKNGIVTGVSTGRAVITATTADGKSASVTINVQEVVTVLLIETPKECEESGIARETINGSMVYVDVLSNIADTEYYLPNVGTFNYTKKDNSIVFNFQRPTPVEGVNEEDFYSAFDFKVQEYVGEGEDRRLVDSDKANFEFNKMIFNGEAIDSMTEIVVTISAKYPKFASRPDYTTVKFTVKVTKGVAVSSWNDMLAVAEENRVLFNSNKSAEVKTPLWDIVLATNIARADGYLPDSDLISQLESISSKVKNGKQLSNDEMELWTENGENTGLKYLKNMRKFVYDTTVYLRGNLYGNGNMVYGFKSQYEDEQDSLLYIIESGVTISNVIARACEVGDQIVDDPEDAQGLTGNAIRLQTVDTLNYALRLTDILIEYCIVENAETLIRTYAGDFTLNGCILRNTSNAALYVPTRRNSTGVMYSHLTVNNCVFSNMIATALNAFFDGYSDDDDPESVAQALKDVEAGRTFILNQTGFWDIYNWHSTDVLNFISDISDINVPVFGKVNLNLFITGALAENTEFKKYSRVYQQTEYLHMGFVISGISKMDGGYGFGTPYPICTFEDERFICVPTSEIFTSDGTYTAMLNGVLNGHDILLYTYGQNGNLTPDTTYQVNNRLIRHLHGEI